MAYSGLWWCQAFDCYGRQLCLEFCKVGLALLKKECCNIILWPNPSQIGNNSTDISVNWDVNQHMWDQNWVCYLHHIPRIRFHCCSPSLLKSVLCSRVANHREMQGMFSFPKGTDYACTMRKGPGHSLWHCRDTSLAEKPLCNFSSTMHCQCH